MVKEISVSWLIASNTDNEKLINSINSILKYSNSEDFEIIVVLNGSAIKNTNFYRKIESISNKIRIYKCHLNGLTHSLNLGLNKSKGNFIARLDAGDFCLIDRHALFIELSKSNNIQVLTTAMKNWKPNININEGFIPFWKLFLGNPFAHPTLFINKNLLVNLGGYQGWETAQDYDLYLRLYMAGHKIYYSKERAVKYEKISYGDSRNFKVAYPNMMSSVLRNVLFKKPIHGFLALLILSIKYITRLLKNLFQIN